MRAAALVAGAILGCCSALAAAQQPAPQQKKLTPQQQLEQQQQKKLTPQQQLERQQKKAAAQNYDTYEPTSRRRPRAGSCNDAEDPLGALCARKCKAGYVAIDDKKASHRTCRSQKPLPQGQAPTPGQKEVSTEVVTKRPPVKRTGPQD